MPDAADRHDARREFRRQHRFARGGHADARRLARWISSTRTALDAQMSSDKDPRHRRARAKPGGVSRIRNCRIRSSWSPNSSAADCPRAFITFRRAATTRTPTRPARSSVCSRTWAIPSKAFVDDLKAQGNMQRVLVMTFSEFGRRVSENANGGTDHGAAAPMFIVGDKVKAGLLGQLSKPRAAGFVRGRHQIQRGLSAASMPACWKTGSRPRARRSSADNSSRCNWFSCRWRAC